MTEAAEATPINEEVAKTQKSMQVNMQNPVLAYQTIVARANPAYIVTLHKLLGTFVECVNELEKK